jgi:hypothetical protein
VAPDARADTHPLGLILTRWLCSRWVPCLLQQDLLALLGTGITPILCGMFPLYVRHVEDISSHVRRSLPLQD